MGELGDDFRAMRDYRKHRRRKLGVECPRCPINRNPTILMPGQTCRVDGYTDPRDPEEKRK